MALSPMIQFADAVGTALVFGATTWFFFIQSPMLLKTLGRERFVPLQMRMTKLLFSTILVALVCTLAASISHTPPNSLVTCSVVAALAAASINRFLVLPQAFRAAGQGLVEARNAAQADARAADFASKGIGNRTKILHRLVGLLVLAMLASLAVHGVQLFSA